jgi:hypothetical protein
MNTRLPHHWMDGHVFRCKGLEGVAASIQASAAVLGDGRKPRDCAIWNEREEER